MLSGKNKYISNYARLYLKPLQDPPKDRIPEKLKRILKPNDSLDFESGSPTSSISDPMEEYYKGTVFEDKSTNRLAQNERHVKILDGFDEKFKRAMISIRENNDLWLEPREEILRNSKKTPKGTNAESQRKKIRALKDPDYLHDDVESLTSTRVSPLTYDYMSGVWKLIEEHSKGKEFFVTPLGFNLYEQSEPHWLENPPVDWKRVEESKEKCRVWLNKYV